MGYSFILCGIWKFLFTAQLNFRTFFQNVDIEYGIRFSFQNVDIEYGIRFSFNRI
jgi:hypothetical protein